MKRLISSILVAIMILASLPLGVMAAENSDITIYYNNEEIQFKNKPVVKNGEVMIDMMPFFDKIGAQYNYNAYKGTVDGYFGEEDDDFHIVVGSDIFTVKRTKLDLVNPFYKVSNTVMISLDRFCYAYNMEYDKSDLSNVKVNYVPVIDTYDRVEEVKSYLAAMDDYKTYIIKGEMADIVEMPQVVREKPETWDEEIIDISDDPTVPYDTAYESEVTTVTETPYAAQITWKFYNNEKVAIKKGDLMVLSFWAKGLWANVENDTARLGFVTETLGTWQKAIIGDFNLTPEWKQYFAYGVAPLDMPNWQFCLRHHYCKQEIQVAGIELMTYTNVPAEFQIPPERASYDGYEDDALWRREAFRRIEEHRKNNLTVNVVDEAGNPIEGAEVKADMFRHEFEWGICVTHYEVGPENIVSDNGYPNWGDNFQELVLNMGFNVMVEGNSLKAASVNPHWAADSANWAKKHDMEVRQHLLFWELENLSKTFLQEHRESNWNLKEVDQDVIRKRLEEEINRLASFGNTMQANEVDVVNEVIARNAQIMRYLGFDETKRWFNMARQIMPNTRLFVTETNTGNRDPYKDSTIMFTQYLDYLKEIGCEFDSVGVQGHAGDANNPAHIIEAFDLVGQYTDKINMTEYDMGTQKESEKPLFLRDNIIAAYSHPKVTGIIMWQPVEGGSPDRGTHFNQDGSLKQPDYDYWMQYVMGEWLTKETFNTDAEGKGTIRGHRGRYNVTVKVGDKEETIVINLTKDEDKNVVNAVVTDSGIKLTCANEHIPEPIEFVDRRDYGELTEIEVPEVNYYVDPATTIEGCESTLGVDLSLLLDEVRETFWRSANKDDAAIVTLADNVPLKHVVIHWHGVDVKKYKRKVEVSEDGETWQTVTTGLNMGVNETVDLSKYTGKYIRISGDNSSIAIDDLEVFTQR